MHEHDWNDGGTGFNGLVLETDILTLIANWATRCFAMPKSLYWPTVVRDGAVDWESAEFPAELRVPPR